MDLLFGGRWRCSQHVTSRLLRQADATVAADRTLLSLGTQPRPRHHWRSRDPGRVSCPHATAATAGKTCLLDRTWVGLSRSLAARPSAASCRLLGCVALWFFSPSRQRLIASPTSCESFAEVETRFLEIIHQMEVKPLSKTICIHFIFILLSVFIP